MGRLTGGFPVIRRSYRRHSWQATRAAVVRNAPIRKSGQQTSFQRGRLLHAASSCTQRRRDIGKGGSKGGEGCPREADTVAKASFGARQTRDERRMAGTATTPKTGWATTQAAPEAGVRGRGGSAWWRRRCAAGSSTAASRMYLSAAMRRYREPGHRGWCSQFGRK